MTFKTQKFSILFRNYKMHKWTIISLSGCNKILKWEYNNTNFTVNSATYKFVLILDSVINSVVSDGLHLDLDDDMVGLYGTKGPLDDQGRFTVFCPGSFVEGKHCMDVVSIQCLLLESLSNLEQTLTLDFGRFLFYQNKHQSLSITWRENT